MKGRNVDPNDDTSSTLLDRVRAKDQEARSRLVYVYSPLVAKWCRKAGLQDADAMDVGQEVFVAVDRAIGRFRKDRPGDSFRGWLYTITRRKITDSHRDAEAGIGGSDAMKRLNLLPAPDESSGEDSRSENQAVIRRALELVLGDHTERSREAFRRVVLDGEAVDDVARDLGLTKGAIYTIKSRVLSRLRREFAELLEFEDLKGAVP